MPLSTSNRVITRKASSRQPVRLLSGLEKPQRCSWPSCTQRARGVDAQKVYCPTHFFAAVSKHWGAVSETAGRADLRTELGHSDADRKR